MREEIIKCDVCGKQIDVCGLRWEERERNGRLIFTQIKVINYEKQLDLCTDHIRTYLLRGLRVLENRND